MFVKNIKVKFKKIRPEAKIPTQGTKSAAGFDLYACVDLEHKLAETDITEEHKGKKKYVIFPHQTCLVPLGFATEIPEGWFGAIYPRSGIALKRNLRLGNCVAVIDADYRGEWMVAIHNDSESVKFVYEGERIAQLVLQEHPCVEFEEVDELEDTERGSGGFGSTGRA